MSLLKRITLWVLSVVDHDTHTKLELSKKYESLLEEAERLIESARYQAEQASYRHFTTLQIYDTDDREYLSAIADVYDSKQFAFFIDILKNIVIANIMNGDEKAGVEGQGILKGIDYIMKNLHAGRQKYATLKNSQGVDL